MHHRLCTHSMPAARRTRYLHDVCTVCEHGIVEQLMGCSTIVELSLFMHMYA